MYTNSTRVSALCNNLSIQKLKYTGWWIVSLKKGHTTEIWPKVLTFFTHWEDEGNALNSKEHEPAKRSHDSTRLVKVESLLVSYVGNTHPMQHRMNQVILTHVPSNWRIVDSRNTKNQQQVHMIVNNCCSLFMCEQSVKNQQQVHMIVNDCWNLFMSEQSAENQQQVHMIVIDCWNLIMYEQSATITQCSRGQTRIVTKQNELVFTASMYLWSFDSYSALKWK